VSDFVLDASVTLAWFLEDEFDDYAEKVGKAVQAGDCPIVPPLWAMECSNALLKAERRGRIATDKADEILMLIKALPVAFDDAPGPAAFNEAFALARKLNRSAYDAMYFERAIRRGVPLASCDVPVRKAAKDAGVKIFLD
jgi:predicted nucleic acid-binding protein